MSIKIFLLIAMLSVQSMAVIRGNIIGLIYPNSNVARPVYRDSNNQSVDSAAGLAVFSDNYPTGKIVFGRNVSSFPKQDQPFSQATNLGLLNKNINQYLACDGQFIYVSSPDRLGCSKNRSVPMFFNVDDELKSLETWSSMEKPIIGKITPGTSLPQIGLFDALWIDDHLNLCLINAERIGRGEPTPTCPNPIMVYYNPTVKILGTALLDINTSSSSGMSAGAAAGVAIGTIAGASALGAAGYVAYQHRDQIAKKAKVLKTSLANKKKNFHPIAKIKSFGKSKVSSLKGKLGKLKNKLKSK